MEDFLAATDSCSKRKFNPPMHLQVYSSTTLFFSVPLDCPSEMRALLVILSVIGAVLAVALALLLIWRVLATIQVSMTSTCSFGHRKHSDNEPRARGHFLKGPKKP